jgi:hypothetical protein
MTADGTRVHSMSLSRQSQKALLRCTWGHRDGWVSRHVFDFYVDRRSASATAQFSVTRPMPMPTQRQTWNGAGRVGARCRARRSGGAAAGAADGVSGSDPRRVSFLRGATSAGCGCSSVDTRQPLASPLLRSKPRDPPSSGVGGAALALTSPSAVLHRPDHVDLRRLLGGILLFAALFTYLLINGYYENVNKMYTRVEEEAPRPAAAAAAAN